MINKYFTPVKLIDYNYNKNYSKIELFGNRTNLSYNIELIDN